MGMFLDNLTNAYETQHNGHCTIFISLRLDAQVIKLPENSHHCNHGLRCTECKLFDKYMGLYRCSIVCFDTGYVWPYVILTGTTSRS